MCISFRFDEELKRGGLSSMDRPTAHALLNWWHLMENCIDGSDDWMKTCGPGHLHYRECDGDPLVTWKRGYSSLFDILMVINPPTSSLSPSTFQSILQRDVPKGSNGLQLPLSDRIFLNKIVMKIDWDRKSADCGVELQCQDGSVYRADYALITCSLGFLKANAQRLFSPSLPVQKTRAIEVPQTIFHFIVIYYEIRHFRAWDSARWIRFI